MWYRISNMTEKQTHQAEPVVPDGEIVSQSDLDMLAEWNAANEASRRTVDLSDVQPISDEGEYADASDDTPEGTAPRGRRRPTTRQVLGWGAAGAAMAVGIAGLAAQGDGDNNSERGELQPSITSITINPDANLRLDPTVPDEYTAPNIALELGAEVTIDATHDIRVLTDTNNGTWYGIDLEDISAKVPDAANVSDEDHIIWVNEQGVTSVQTDQVAQSETE